MSLWQKPCIALKLPEEVTESEFKTERASEFDTKKKYEITVPPTLNKPEIRADAGTFFREIN